MTISQLKEKFLKAIKARFSEAYNRLSETGKCDARRHGVSPGLRRVESGRRPEEIDDFIHVRANMMPADFEAEQQFEAKQFGDLCNWLWYATHPGGNATSSLTRATCADPLPSR